MKSFFAFVVLSIFATSAFAEGPQRKILVQGDGPSGYQIIVTELQFAPGAQEEKHTHPGQVVGYIAEGEATLENDGVVKSYKAGEAFYVDAGKVHAVKNAGSTTLRVVATLAVEKGKPPTSPAK